MLHARHVIEEGDAWHTAQGFAVFNGHLVAGFNGLVYLAEVEDAVGGTHLVYLAVDARAHHGGLVGETEVLEVVDALLHLLVAHHQGTALYGVVHLGSMETEGGEVARIEDALAADLHAKCMSGIVDDLQAIAVCNLLNAHGIAGLAVDMHRHDGRCFGGDGRLYLLGVEIASGRVDVNKDGLDAVPPQRVGGGHKAVRRGDDLARDAEGLQRSDERQGAVGKQTDERHFEIGSQLFFQLPVEATIVGDPLAAPDLFEEFVELAEVGEQRRSNRYLFLFKHD